MIGWITDPHLSFVSSPEKVGEKFKNDYPDVTDWIITGDIAESFNFISNLYKLKKGLGKKIYFILGNHDYYHSSFEDTLNELIDFAAADIISIYKQEVINFGDICLVGNSGWYDGRSGNSQTRVMLNDFNYIEELVPGKYNRDLLLNVVQKWADFFADDLDDTLSQAVEKTDKILIATHVPPFPEACWHEGEVSNRDWQPWFTSIATGRMIDKYCQKYPEKEFMVLTGHTHSSGRYKHSENCTVFTGKSVYGNPMVSGTIDLEGFKLTTT